jgi:hypothetical protein
VNLHQVAEQQHHVMRFLVFAYAYIYDTSMGHYTWYLVPCSERSLMSS